jgi:hypothetical protein
MFRVSRIVISYLTYKQDIIVFLGSLGGAEIQVKVFLYSYRFNKNMTPGFGLAILSS